MNAIHKVVGLFGPNHTLRRAIMENDPDLADWALNHGAKWNLGRTEWVFIHAGSMHGHRRALLKISGAVDMCVY